MQKANGTKLSPVRSLIHLIQCPALKYVFLSQSKFPWNSIVTELGVVSFSTWKQGSSLSKLIPLLFWLAKKIKVNCVAMVIYHHMLHLFRSKSTTSFRPRFHRGQFVFTRQQTVQVFEGIYSKSCQWVQRVTVHNKDWSYSVLWKTFSRIFHKSFCE